MNQLQIQELGAGLELAITETGNRLLPFFRFTHLPTHLQATSAGFAELAIRIVRNPDMNNGAEQTVALRKVLEGKDAAVRACLK